MIVAGSLFLLLVGAILLLAVGIPGLIVIIVGALGVAFGLVQQASWARRGRRPSPPADRPPPP